MTTTYAVLEGHVILEFLIEQKRFPMVHLNCFVCGEEFEDIQDDCFPATDFPLRHFHKLIFLMNKMPELTPESAASLLRVDENKVGCMRGILDLHFNRKMIEIVSHIKNITQKDLSPPFLSNAQIELISQLVNIKSDDKSP